MAPKANNDVSRLELIRLLEGLDYYRAWCIACLKRDKGRITEEDLNQFVVPGSFFLQLFDDKKGRAGAYVIKEVQQWYSHTASELSYMINSGEETWAADARQFLQDFQKDVGFDFYAEAGFLRKLVNKVLKARKIAKQADYYALIEIEKDLSHSVVSTAELAEISQLLHAYENNKKTQ